jgi:hypothetical protein
MELCTQKTATKLLKLQVRDPLSGKKQIPDPGPRVNKSQDPRSESATMIKSKFIILCTSHGHVWRGEDRYGGRVMEWEWGGGDLFSNTYIEVQVHKTYPEEVSKSSLSVADMCDIESLLISASGETGLLL